MSVNKFSQNVFILFLCFRLLCAYINKTSFVPDEYWQSLEVSHKLAFGYGHLTWEWDKKIRTCFYPFVFYLLYKIIPDFSFLIIYFPKILQAILSSFGDYFTFKLVRQYFGESASVWTVFNILISWFLSYCSSRTLSNTAESSLTSCGLYFYPWIFTKRKDFRRMDYLWFAGISIIIRPTAFIIWLPLYLWHMWRQDNVALFFRHTILIGFTCLTCMCLIDRWCYGQWILAHYNFFLFNWSNDIGAFYGSHKFWWYFIIGLPVMLAFQIIPFLLGLFDPKLNKFNFLILWFLLVLSLPSHKEFRFLLPVLHICLINCGVVMSKMWNGKMYVFKIKIPEKTAVYLSALLVLTNIPLFLYMGLIHQRGVIDAIIHLSERVDEKSNVLFLMPCHSTPYYSYVHKNIKMKFLSCEPNFENDENYVEEADEFFAHPLKWLEMNYEENEHLLPSRIVMFDTLLPQISEFLVKYQYKSCYSAFHSHFPESRTGKYVLIYCKL